ncbi:MAG: molybdate ABC transporter permease subunit [Rhodospirillales bacterium]
MLPLAGGCAPGPHHRITAAPNQPVRGKFKPEAPLLPFVDSFTADEWQAIRLTLVVASRAVLVDLPLALGLALLLSRGRFAGRGLLDTVAHLPLVLPPVVVGWLLLLLFGLHGPVGALLYVWFDVRLVFTRTGAILACAVMILPLMLRAIRLSLETVDPGLEQAARSLGAGPWDRFLSITLPLAAPGVLVAAITGFAAALGEFGAVITFAANIPGQTQTLPLAIYSALQSPGGAEAAARLSLVSVGLAVVFLTVAESLGRRLRARVGR